LAGATCRLAAQLHLASHLRDGWTHPIGADTFTDAARLAGYRVEHGGSASECQTCAHRCVLGQASRC
jgi:Protein of unknown function (DUF3987)